MNQKIGELREQVRGFEAQQLAVNDSLAIIAAELKDQNLLLEKGLTQRPRVLELERTAAGLRGQQGGPLLQSPARPSRLARWSCRSSRRATTG
jgi:HlyD family secretion protein